MSLGQCSKRRCTETGRSRRLRGRTMLTRRREAAKIQSQNVDTRQTAHFPLLPFRVLRGFAGARSLGLALEDDYFSNEHDATSLTVSPPRRLSNTSCL